MPQGGKREGAGRPGGSRNKRTVQVEERAREAAAALAHAIPGAFEGDAHALLMAIYKDPAQPMALRLEAAGKAIRYEKPALAAVEMEMSGGVRHVILDRPMTIEEWEATHCVPTEH